MLQKNILFLQRTPATENRHPHAALILHETQHLDLADSARTLNMRAAAGTNICTFDAYNAHLAFKRLLAAILHRLKLLFVRKKGFNRHVLPDDLIGQPLHAADVVLRKRAVKVHGHSLGANVKTHVVIAKEAAHKTGEDMLAAVLLHHVEPALRIHAALNRCANRQRGVGRMQHFAARLMDIQHIYAAQHAMVCALSAALRKKRRSIKGHNILTLFLLAAGDDRRKRKQLRILIVQTHGHMIHSFRKNCQKKTIDALHHCITRAEKFHQKFDHSKNKFFHMPQVVI